MLKYRDTVNAGESWSSTANSLLFHITCWYIVAFPFVERVQISVHAKFNTRYVPLFHPLPKMGMCKFSLRSLMGDELRFLYPFNNNFPVGETFLTGLFLYGHVVHRLSCFQNGRCSSRSSNAGIS